MQAVQVQVGAVEGVGLDGAGLAVERRVGADGDRGRPAVRLLARLVQGGEPAGVDAVGRDRGVRGRLDVRRREAELAAALVPADDDPLDAVRTAERLGRLRHVAGREKLPDGG